MFKSLQLNAFYLKDKLSVVILTSDKMLLLITVTHIILISKLGYIFLLVNVFCRDKYDIL